MPFDRGLEFRLPMALPGVQSGVAHSAFVMSAVAANHANGFTLLASSHRGAKHPWAFFLRDVNEYDHLAPSVTPFDVTRPIGVEQMFAVANIAFGDPIGRISPSALAGPGGSRAFGAADALRVQFALNGYPASLAKLGIKDDFSRFASQHAAASGPVQFSVWQTTGLRPSFVVLVSNDKHNHYAEHVQALPVRQVDPADPWAVQLASLSALAVEAADGVTLEMVTLRKQGMHPALSRRVSKLSDADVEAVRALLARVFT